MCAPAGAREGWLEEALLDKPSACPSGVGGAYGAKPTRQTQVWTRCAGCDFHPQAPRCAGNFALLKSWFVQAVGPRP